eukprot:SAG31_NODE_354_length_17223_cov_18.708771_14_plen_64_part_00
MRRSFPGLMTYARSAVQLLVQAQGTGGDAAERTFSSKMSVAERTEHLPDGKIFQDISRYFEIF